MTWRVVIPFKPPGARKTRLTGRLDPAARDALALAMLDRVARASRDVAETVLLCAERPPGWTGAWVRDGGEGLNAELARMRGAAAVAVIHGDLPLIDPADVRALLTGAGATGLALAPDRHDQGTNAVAVDGGVRLDFVFGPGSFAAFVAQRPAAIIRRPGLALDVDTAEDFDAAVAAGFAFATRSGGG